MVRPSAAIALSSRRIQRMPSGSSPLTGSSSSSTGGSASSAAAMPSRCFMPSENSPVRRAATDSSPVSSSTSLTRRSPMPLLCARASRWNQAERPAGRAVASSSEPTWCSGRTNSW